MRMDENKRKARLDEILAAKAEQEKIKRAPALANEYRQLLGIGDNPTVAQEFALTRLATNDLRNDVKRDGVEDLQQAYALVLKEVEAQAEKEPLTTQVPDPVSGISRDYRR